MEKNTQNQIRVQKNYLKASFNKAKKLLLLLLMIISLGSILPAAEVFAAASKTDSLNITVCTGKSLDLYNYLDNVDSVKSYIKNCAGVSYTSGNRRLVTIGKSGIIKGVAKGKTQITVTFIYKVRSANSKKLGTATKKKLIYVKVIPDDGSTKEEYFNFSIKKGKVTINGLLEDTSALVIPQQIDGFPVTAIAPNAFRDSDIISFSCLGNIETIGEGAFYNCTGLKKVSLCNSVKVIGNSAFWGCSNLETLTLSKSLTTVSESAFEYCSKLSDVNLGDHVVMIGKRAFSQCSSLNILHWPGKLEVIDDFAFSNCNALTKLTLTNRLKRIGKSAFRECSALKTVESQNEAGASTDKASDYWNKENIIDTEAFVSCSALEYASMPNSISLIGDRAFLSCTSLNTLTIPEGITAVGEMAFGNCTAISELSLPNSLVKFGDYAFSYCNGLSKITVNNDIPREADSSVFRGTSFSSITVAYAANVTFYFTSADWDEIHKLNDALSKMGILDTDSEAEKIRKVHDWLVINTSYSYNQFIANYEQIGIIDTVLDKHFAICAAYAEVFKCFMDLLKIESICVTSEAMNHEWNMVKLDDGYWYHVDVTWDDPGYNSDVFETGGLFYENLLLDDQGIMATGHYKWQEDAPAANGTKYLNYFDHSYYKIF